MAGSKTPHNNNNVLSSNRIDSPTRSLPATNHCRHEHCRFVSSSPLPATAVDTTAQDLTMN
jgi:hypothetical protein